MFQTQIIKKQLHFKQPAGTSRGVYTTRMYGTSSSPTPAAATMAWVNAPLSLP